MTAPATPFAQAAPAASGGGGYKQKMPARAVPPVPFAAAVPPLGPKLGSGAGAASAAIASTATPPKPQTQSENAPSATAQVKSAPPPPMSLPLSRTSSGPKALAPMPPFLAKSGSLASASQPLAVDHGRSDTADVSQQRMTLPTAPLQDLSHLEGVAAQQSCRSNADDMEAWPADANTE